MIPSITSAFLSAPTKPTFGRLVIRVAGKKDQGNRDDELVSTWGPNSAVTAGTLIGMTLAASQAVWAATLPHAVTTIPVGGKNATAVTFLFPRS